MKIIVCLLALLFSSAALAQIATVDVVKGKAKYEKEVMYFFEHNWKVFREEALKLDYIAGYDMIRTAPDSTGLFNVILITRFSDSTQYKNVERNFAPLMKRLSPGGPKLLNNVPRKDLIDSATGWEGAIVAEDRKKR